MLSRLLNQGLSPSSPAAAGQGGLIEAALRYNHEEIAMLLAEHGFRLLPHARSIYRGRLASVFAKYKRKVDKSLQATRDGVSSSAFADYVISPACLYWVVRPFRPRLWNPPLKN
jgi:hypothetical protein